MQNKVIQGFTFFFIICFAICFIVLFIQGCAQESNFLQDEYAGLFLKKRLTGSSAKKFVDRLHSQEVSSSKNEIGFYKWKDSEAVIYVTDYETPDQAIAEGLKMIHKIDPGHKIFSQGQFFVSGGKQIYHCFGMGQTHFIFSNQEQLFWISVEPTMAEPFLSAVLTAIQ